MQSQPHEHTIPDPDHVVLIMDGNWRQGLKEEWVRRSETTPDAYNQLRMQQHECSYQTVRDLVSYFFQNTDSNILSLRALASWNVTHRSPEQTTAILWLVEKAVNDAQEQLREWRINFNVLWDDSRLDTFSPGVVDRLQDKIDLHRYPESEKQLVAILDYDVYFDYYQSIKVFIHKFIAANQGSLVTSNNIWELLHELGQTSKEQFREMYMPDWHIHFNEIVGWVSTCWTRVNYQDMMRPKK